MWTAAAARVCCETQRTARDRGRLSGPRAVVLARDRLRAADARLSAAARLLPHDLPPVARRAARAAGAAFPRDGRSAAGRSRSSSATGARPGIEPGDIRGLDDLPKLPPYTSTTSARASSAIRRSATSWASRPRDGHAAGAADERRHHRTAAADALCAAGPRDDGDPRRPALRAARRPAGRPGAGDVLARAWATAAWRRARRCGATRARCR